KGIRVWDVKTGKYIRNMTGHTGAVMGVALTLDGKRLLSASGDKTARLWNLETGQELRRFEGHRDSVMSVAVNSDGQTFLTGSMDRPAGMWGLTGADKPVAALTKAGSMGGAVMMEKMAK